MCYLTMKSNWGASPMKVLCKDALKAPIFQLKKKPIPVKDPIHSTQRASQPPIDEEPMTMSHSDRNPN